jgi:hypothetical protein
MDIDLQLRDLERQARERNGGRPIPLRDWVELAEAWRIAQALRETRGNRSAAARRLGIGRRTLYTKMEKLGLTPVWLVGTSAAILNTEERSVARGALAESGRAPARSVRR